MKKEEIIKKIEEYKEYLKEKGVERVGLFGSFLRGKATKNSDVDIIIKINNISFDKYADLLILLERLFKRKVDLILESDLRPELNYIKSEAEYARI